MTFEESMQKLLKRWWWPFVLAILVGLTSLPFLQSERYQATITLSITTVEDRNIIAETIFPNVNKELIEIDPKTWEKLNPDNVNRDIVYFRLLGTISGYFVNRFAGVDVQSQIAQDLSVNGDNLTRQDPFYEIINTGFGSITLAYTGEDRSQVEEFAQIAENAFVNLVDEWNTEKDVFAIQFVDNAIEPSITRITPSIQEYILPLFAGLTLGLTLAILIPIFKKN